MISLQTAEGSWNLDLSLAEVLGLPLAAIQAASPLADQSVFIANDLENLMNSDKCNNSSQLWATALALSWFYRKRPQFEAEWFLAAQKAEDWLRGIQCPRGFLPEDLKALAWQALLLLEREMHLKNSIETSTPQKELGGRDLHMFRD